MVKIKNAHCFIFLFVLILLFSCNSGDKDNKVDLYTDTPEKGSIQISVDETFRPIIEEELKVYKSSYPETNIKCSFKPEVECFKDLTSDSTRMIITARRLNEKERKYYETNLHFSPQQGIVAFDAVALITNIGSKDSIFTLKGLKEILTGKNNVTTLLDGKNATSTVRYLQDSILKGLPFGPNVVSGGGSKGVIDKVVEQTGYIGFVGLSWVGDGYDIQQRENLKKIRICRLECTQCPNGTFAKPSQATISYREYPLIRPISCIVKENAIGLGTGFLQFLNSERGQLIFRKSFIAPAIMCLDKRTANL